MKRKTKTALVVLVVLLVALFGGSAVMAAGTGSVIKDGLAKFGPAHPHKGAGAGIGTLVKDGTLTEKQVQAVMEALRPEKAGEIKDMSEVLSSLVKAGTINEAQAEAIKKLMPNRQHGRFGCLNGEQS